MRFNWTGSSCVLLMLFLSVWPLFAQDGLKSYTSEDTVYVSADRAPRVPAFNSIAARMPMPIFKTPAAVQVVTGTVVEEQGGIVLADALANVSGVNPQSGNGTHDYFIIRGFDSLEGGLLLTDGTPEPEAMINNMYNVERVEVLKGPGAFLYGGNPLSGTVNLVRKQAQFQNFGVVSVSDGSFDTWHTTADLNISNEKDLAFRLNAVAQGSNEYRDDKSNKVYGINPALTWKPTAQSQLDLNAEYVDSRYQPDSGIPVIFTMDMTSSISPVYQSQGIADVPRERSYQTPYDESVHKMKRVKLNYNLKLADHISLNEKLYYTDLQWDSQGALINGAYGVGYGMFMVNRTMNILNDRQKILGSQTEMAFNYNFNSVKYKLLTGLEANRFTDVFSIDVIAQLPMMDLFNPVETFNGDFSGAYRYQQGDAETITLAPYVLNIVTLPCAVDVMAGGRFDHITFKEEINKTDRDYDQFSPMIGIGYAPVKTVYLYANAGSAFAPPSVRVVGPREPEKSAQYEAGIKSQWLGGRIQSTLAVYSLERKDIAIPDRTGLTKQNGTQKSQGVEFDVTARMTDHCTSFFSYTYTDAELTKFSEQVPTGMYTDLGLPVYNYYDYAGNQAAFSPKHMVNFWHFRDIGRFTIGAGVRYVSDQYIYYDNVDKIDSYTTLDASVSCRIRDYDVFLHAKNITSSEYELRGFGAGSVIPAAPFAIYGGINLNLNSL